ncbi:MAG: hypothetical protein JWP34_4565 [Massilia sp.]|nr:hypothetical protein [Gemmatimonadales bacterium]MDB5910451.1 hypothetical protein [Massilia sp.]
MRLIRPRVDKVTTIVRSREPIGSGIASALAELHGRGIKGQVGTLQYGYPGDATQRRVFKGYVYPPSMFIGWNPNNVAGGTVQNKVGQLPATAPPNGTYSPLIAAMANVSAAGRSGWGIGGQ